LSEALTTVYCNNYKLQDDEAGIWTVQRPNDEYVDCATTADEAILIAVVDSTLVRLLGEA
jgi:hypothetical protein